MGVHPVGSGSAPQIRNQPVRIKTAVRPRLVHEIKHDGHRMIAAVMAPQCGFIVATRMTGRRLQELDDRARRLCSGPTELRSREAAHATSLRLDFIERDGEDCASSHSLTARPHWRDCCVLACDKDCGERSGRQ
jgi:hypothetical protein